jgi:tetratricopeptide (TPR) repeat protein/predicted Ser/Thr protein kinase
MTPERWQRVKDLCQRALEREPLDRGAFLAERCLDDHELRREVETLLAQATGGEGILDAPVWQKLGIAPGMARAGSPSAPWVPEAIGRYRVRRLIGEGGMGSVYEAEQDQPRRVVALKVIKAGLTSPELLRRFERESQALGRLQHPGIAQIYEVGTADAGTGPLPYFAMEFINGTPLRDYTESHRLGTRDRLELIARVCDAVEHAHQRGIIHRDLKPGNILMDGSRQPKILDFGVARVTDSDAEVTRQTDLGQLVGTLAYMSPEQVLADPLELDTRSDVYALGVILYELLAARLPYQLSSKLIEAARTIQEEDPARLSSISRAYRGDVETIVAKALEKDKARRYSSAAALAADIRRYLADEPIAARPASTAYQLHKFARRHKALVGGVAAVFVALAAGTIVSTWQALRARAAQRVAVAAEQRVIEERDTATRERNRALAADAQSQQERNQAIAEKHRADNEAAIETAVSEFLRRDLLAQASAKSQSRPDIKPDPDLKVRTALDRAAVRIGSTFAGKPLVEASIRQTIGTAYQDLGLYPEARQQLERALDLRRNALGEHDPATLELLSDVARSYNLEGKYPEAERLYVRALEGLQRAYGKEHADVRGVMSDLSLVYQSQGRFAEAEVLLRQVLAIQRRVAGVEDPETADNMANLAYLYLNQGKYRQAESQYVEALAGLRRLRGPDHPDTIATLNGLALTYRGLGKHAESESMFLEALDTERRALGPEHPNTLSTMNNLALVYTNEGRYREAGPFYEDILAVRRRVVGPEHPDTLLAMNNLGNLYSEMGRFSDAASLLAAAFDGRKRVLGAEHPNTLNTMTNVAQLHFRQGRWKESETLFTEILATRRRVLGNEHPSTVLTMNHLGLLYSRSGRWREAEALLTSAREFWSRTFGAEHQQTLWTIDQLGDVSLRRGDFAQAEALLTKAFAGRLRVLGHDHPDTLRSAVNVAGLYREMNRTAEAESTFVATLATERKLFGDEHPDTLAAMTGLADLYLRQGKYVQAQTLLDEALRGRRRVLGPRHPETMEALSMLGLVLLQRQQYADAETLLMELTIPDPSTATWHRFQGESILGAALAAEQKFADAEKSLVEGYQGMFEQVATIPVADRPALDRAGQELVRLYQAWGKPERAVEWRERLSVRHRP